MFGSNFFDKSYYLKSDNLYDIVPPDEIYWRYLSFRPKENQKIKCVFHKEKTPSLSFKNGKFKCFGCGKSGDAIAFVMELFNCDYNTAVFKIYDDFKLNNKVNIVKKNVIVEKTKKKIIFSHTIRKFNNFDIDYWGGYDINIKDLEFYKINAVSHVDINNFLVWIELPDNPIYHLECWNKVGIESRYYRPFNTAEFGRNKENKWIGSTKYNSIFGYNQLLILMNNKQLKKDILFITSSLKDVITLYKSGYYAIASSAETNFIDLEQIEFLKNNFKNIYVFFNNDKAGKLNSLKYTQKYNLNYINLPDKYLIKKIKDPSDMVKKINREELNKIIKEKLIRDNVVD